MNQLDQPKAPAAPADANPCDAESLAGNYFVSTYPPFSAWSAGNLEGVRRAFNRAPAPAAPALGLYIHIPFCAQRCDYCYFRSYAGTSLRAMTDYIDVVAAELAVYRRTPALAGRKLDFVYFGGGTPSLLSAEEITRLARTLQAVMPWSELREATFECAPKSVSLPKLIALRAAGVNRLSLGVQQLDDDVLQLNGRVHLTQDVERAYDAIRQVGFPVVNLDLIVGLLGETEDSFFKSLERVLALAPESITIYQLEIPANTPLYAGLANQSLPAVLPSWRKKRQRLGEAFLRLEEAGYNVATACAAVRDPVQHRFLYQQEQYRGADLLGLGCSSFSYLSGVHFQNQASLERYRESLGNRQLPWQRAYLLSAEERMIREFVLQLKLGRADAGYFRDKFAVDLSERFADQLTNLADSGWLTFGCHGVVLTREGLLRADRLLSEFYLPDHRQAPYW